MSRSGCRSLKTPSAFSLQTGRGSISDLMLLRIMTRLAAPSEGSSSMWNSIAGLAARFVLNRLYCILGVIGHRER